MLVSIDHRQDHLSTVRGLLSAVVYPVQYAAQWPVELVDRVAENVATRRALMKENRNLRDENLLLRARAQRFAALERENQRLRELLDSAADLTDEVVVADVLAIDSNPASHQIVINKGSRHNVYVGQPIADAHGILGQVTRVGPYTSTVILVSDPRHALPVQINRSGLRAIATGSGEGEQLLLSFIPTNADIRTGDLVVSSGLDHRFPAGYPVGEVTSLEVDPGAPFARIVVQPAAHIGRSREVLLVWPRGKVEAPAPAETATAQAP